MTPYFDNGFARLYQADARHLPIPDSSVDCVVTSPPYWGLRNYGLDEQGLGLEPTPEAYCANMVEVFREVWRALKPTGTVWLNLGDSYSGGGGAHKPEHANPGLSKSAERNGVPTSERDVISGLKPKDLVGIPWRVAFALQADGWYLRSDIIWSKPNPMPESVQDRPTSAHEYVFLLTKSPRYYYDADAIKEPASYAGAVINLGEKSFAKRQALGANVSPSGNGLSDTYVVPDGRNKRSVWWITPQPYKEAHFATYPEKLVEPCILAGCPQDGVVLDPFAGSGTTLAVAQRLGRKSIGTDLSEKYLKMASKRLGAIPLPMILV
jgi:DNA modification methylase